MTRNHWWPLGGYWYRASIVNPDDEEDIRQRPFSLSFEEEVEPYYHLLKRDTCKVKIKLV